MTSEKRRWGTVETRFGIFTIWVDAVGRLVELWLRPMNAYKFDPSSEQSDKAVAHVAKQVKEYAAGKRRDFALELAPKGTPFQHEVWNELAKIPFGATTSYGALAKTLGRVGGARAVGLANGSNPIGLVVPCHRVIGSDGSLTGYGGGLPLKRALLAHEAEVARGETDLFAPIRRRVRAQ